MPFLWKRLLGDDPVEKRLQFAAASRMPHLADGLGLDLADALARDVEHATDFFERARVAVAQAEAQAKHPLFAFSQRLEYFLELLLEHGKRGRIDRGIGRFVLDEVAEAAVALVAYRCFE